MESIYSARQEALTELMRKLATVLERERHLSIFGTTAGCFAECERVECLQISVLSCARPRLCDQVNWII